MNVDKYEWGKWKEIAEQNGINRHAFMKRIKGGWTRKEAANRPLVKKGKKSAHEMQIYTVYKHRDPVFTGLSQACADYLQVDQEHIYDHSKIKNCIIFEVE